MKLKDIVNDKIKEWPKGVKYFIQSPLDGMLYGRNKAGECVTSITDVKIADDVIVRVSSLSQKKVDKWDVGHLQTTNNRIYKKKWEKMQNVD